LNALSPRNKIRYFYLSTVRRAGQRGVERRKNHTPLEYSDDLKENWPHSDGDLDSLTAAFLRARYNPKEIKEEEIEPVKRIWKRIKPALRERKKRNNSD
jgi:hypothetical protein